VWSINAAVVFSRFVALSTCLGPYVDWASSCTSDSNGDDDDDVSQPLASAPRRFQVSRRLRDWTVLVQLLTADCADPRPEGTYTHTCRLRDGLVAAWWRTG